MTSRRILWAALAAACGSALMANAATAADIVVSMDEARLVTFGQPVKTVFVGNPSIADITVVDSRHIFVLGKAYGTTNLIALDEGGNQTINDQISVFGRPGTMVTVQRGVAQSTLACDGLRCEATPLPGDDADKYEAVSAQIEKRQDMASKAAGGGGAAAAPAR
jgi:hypothetical protein